jgi:hypothetical protein
MEWVGGTGKYTGIKGNNTFNGRIENQFIQSGATLAMPGAQVNLCQRLGGMLSVYRGAVAWRYDSNLKNGYRQRPTGSGLVHE